MNVHAAAPVIGVTVVKEMRRARRKRRLGDLEWFEIAYRVYLAALVGGVAVAWLSDLVTDDPVTPAQLADVTTHGPAWLGLAAVAAVALGLRSGSDGGPVSLEAGDARHLMMAPVPRRAVLIRPVVQRARAVAFGGALLGAIAGQLAARRLPGSAPAWAASGAAAGALVGVAFVAVATIVHAFGVPRWAATLGAAVLVGGQGAAVVSGLPGPGDGIGSLALWGMRTRPLDLVAAGVVVAAGAFALAVCDRLRIEPLVRRADLVSQLRFAVTLQDLRTVVLLRRQLRGERPRDQPWVRLPRSPGVGPTGAVWRRDLHGLLRYPAARLVRMAVLAAAAGAAAVVTVRGTTPAIVAVGGALYLLGLDAVEPLSQEIDHPDLSEGVPHPAGWLLLRHLAAPALATVPFALLGSLVVTAADVSAGPAAFALGLPVTWAGVCGAVVSVVRDSPNPTKPSTANIASAAVPPEFGGFTSSLRLLFPVVISSIGALTILAMREQPTAGTAVRMAVLDFLVVGATGLWVHRRVEWSAAWQRLLAGGRAEQEARRSGTPT